MDFLLEREEDRPERWLRPSVVLGLLTSTTPTPVEERANPTRQALAAAYEAGATDSHNDWLNGHGERGARTSEEAMEYADAVLRAPVSKGQDHE